MTDIFATMSSPRCSNTPEERNRLFSSLSLAQWQEIEGLADAAAKARTALTHKLLATAGQLVERDPCLCTALIEVASKDLPAYFFHPQPEWTGGDSMDPKNTITREPHVAPMPRRRVA